MQVLDERKRRRILDVAADFFSSRPYHEVRLSDLAAEAGVGKGTLYVYFQSKEDLFQGVLFEGFAGLVDGLESRFAGQQLPPERALEVIVREMVHFGSNRPKLFELMRSLHILLAGHPKWEAKRRTLATLLESTLRRGVEEGVFDDPHPELTAIFIPAMVRATLLYASGSQPDSIAGHILRNLQRSLRTEKSNGVN